MPDLLIELFSEEIPARMQARAREDLKKLVTDGLVEAGLTYASAGAFSTPRRLVLSVEGLTGESRPVREERKGPRTDCARAGGGGVPAVHRPDAGPAGARGPTRRARPSMPSSKSRAARRRRSWPRCWKRVIRNFPWPKSMRWGVGHLALGAAVAVDPVPAVRRGRRACRAAGRSTGSSRATRPRATASWATGGSPCTGFDDYVVEAEARQGGAGHRRARGRDLAGRAEPGLCGRDGGGRRTRGFWPRSRGWSNGRCR